MVKKTEKQLTKKKEKNKISKSELNKISGGTEGARVDRVRENAVVTGRWRRD